MKTLSKIVIAIALAAAVTAGTASAPALAGPRCVNTDPANGCRLVWNPNTFSYDWVCAACPWG